MECTAESVPKFDRAAIGFNNATADEYSYFTQNLSGILALSVPPAWAGALAVFGKLMPATAIAWAATDLILVAETTALNGMIGELTKITVQRPRPFVYVNPSNDGANPSNYISFYSGHTSYAAASTTAMFLILLSRNPPLIMLFASALAIPTLTILTGMLRVMAGRHFLTDVTAAAIIGSLIALAVAYFHRPPLDEKE